MAPTDRIDLAYSAFNQPIANETLKGGSIKQFLLTENEIKSFYLVRRYLEGAAS
jgi:hypothetical protein